MITLISGIVFKIGLMDTIGCPINTRIDTIRFQVRIGKKCLSIIFKYINMKIGVKFNVKMIIINLK